MGTACSGAVPTSLRIVLIMGEPPLPFGGAAARWYYVLLKGLVERGHRVTAFAMCRNSHEVFEAKALFPPTCYDLRLYLPEGPNGGLRSKARTLLRPYSYIYSRALRQDLDAELLRPYDILHLEQLWSAWLALGHRRRSLVNIHSLYSIDWQCSVYDSLYDRLRRAHTVAAERKLLRLSPNVLTLTEQLSAAVRRMHPAAVVQTVPIALELSLYPLGPAPTALAGGKASPTVSLIGAYSWGPTRSAAVRLILRLWPEIRRRVPEARLLVVGRGAAEHLSDFAKVPGITILDSVPDTRPYFNATDVMLYAPERGSGIKVKVLEAFALGTPVVTTPDGVEGLAAVDGVHAGVCADDAGLIDRTVQLLGDVDARARLRRAARKLMEQSYAPGPVLDQLEQAYRKALSPGTGGNGGGAAAGVA